MKKIGIIIAFVIGLFNSTNAIAQLNAQNYEDAVGYKTVWTLKDACIRHFDNGDYVLLAPTNNDYENTMASIVLGNTKESAILSLKELQKIVKKETKLSKGGVIVKGCNGKKTHIFKSQGTFAIKTDFVAGESYILWHMKNRFEDAENAINKFNEEN